MKRGQWQEMDEKLFSVSLVFTFTSHFHLLHLNQKISIRTLTFFPPRKDWMVFNSYRE